MSLPLRLPRLVGFVPAFLSLVAAALPAPTSETEIRYLSGTGPDDAVPWDFYCTGGRNSGFWTTIPVPSCWEQHGFGTYNYGVQHRPGRTNPNPPPLANEQGRYRHEFTVPAEWRGRAVRIVFEAAMTDTEVRINAQPAGPVHQGGFYRFHYDITPLLRFGETNVLEVTVSKKSANESVNRAERLGDYWIFGGIYRPVWLEARPVPSIEWTAIDARADGSFTAAVHLGAPAPAGASLVAQIFDPAGQPTGPLALAAVPAGATSVTVRESYLGERAWTAETPHLYRVRFTLMQAGQPLHEVTERFGFRTFEVRKEDGLYLNGTRLRLKGVNRHCFWPETGRTLSREQSYADVRLIKAMNMNAVRMSHYPPDPHFLAACDELGLYVLDELAGWQGSYDTPTATRLIGQIVRRDVNHPSILFWDNGNEGGWNTEVDGEFAKWDPQRRAVLHPWEKFSDIDTNHYEGWESHLKLTQGPMLYLPTEILHGLYDGGHGAGLRNYWDAIRASPTAAGMFLWVFADEGLVRTDQGGRIDNAGNLAPDGLVGPHHEREGSFYAVKEIWSPVQVTAPVDERGCLPTDWDGKLQVANHYDFTNLKLCSFDWRVQRVPGQPSLTAPTETAVYGRLPGPDVGPGQTGTIELPLPVPPLGAVLHVTARGPDGAELWTSSWGPSLVESHAVSRPPAPQFVVTDDEIVVTGAGIEARWNRTTGLLAALAGNGRRLPLEPGPQLVGYQRKERIFEQVLPAATGVTIGARLAADRVIVEATSTVPAMTWRWTLDPSGELHLAYEYSVDGEFDILGLRFGIAPGSLVAKRWLGRGPYRVWQNRQEGGVFDVHEVAFNDSTPGESYAYPEFNGYFRDWRWLALQTRGGALAVSTPGNVPYFALGRPRDGEKGLFELPDMGLAFLHVLPAIGTKFNFPPVLGPQSQPQRVSGVRTGHLTFRLTP